MTSKTTIVVGRILDQNGWETSVVLPYDVGISVPMQVKTSNNEILFIYHGYPSCEKTKVFDVTLVPRDKFVPDAMEGRHVTFMQDFVLVFWERKTPDLSESDPGREAQTV